ncbi:MAG: phosphotransferase enzyme family protein [Candidatus Acidiferrales bacterium]
MSGEVKAHGLEGNLVAPDWPALKLDELDGLLRRYPQAQKAQRILSFSPRPFSAASVVETPTGNVFVKRHHRAVRDRYALLEEHRWLGYLSRRDTLVKRPLEDESGETVVEIGEWTYEVHPVGDGLDLYETAQSWTPFLSVGHARHAGRALARLHAASAGYDAPARKAATLVTSFKVLSRDDPWPELARYVEERPALHSYLAGRDWLGEAQETFHRFHGRLRKFLHVFQPLWTHNDFHGSNLFWSNSSCEAEVTDIIDVGLADRTNALHDIATAIERNGVDWLEIHDASRNPLHLEQIDALLSGYEEMHPLSREEAEAVAALLPLVHAEFALSEADYFLRVLKSREKADLAYIGYFLGHARWFDSDAGKRLLNHLQSLAELHQGNAAARLVVSEEARK